MAKLESSLKNMVLSLLLISMVMSAILGFVYNATKDPIAQAGKVKELNAVKEVLPDFDNNPAADPKEIDGMVFYKATKADQLVGYAAKTFTDKGYGGRFDLMVGFLPGGTINKVVVLEQKETPGLGSNMTKPKFKDQFNNLNISTLKDKKLRVKKDGGTVDAISAATISSRAFCDGLQKAYDAYMSNFVNPGLKSADATSGSTKPAKETQGGKQ